VIQVVENKVKNVFVLFAPGLGGNHLANLISTDSRFQSRTTLDNYKNSNTKYAHHYDIENLNIENKIQDYSGNVLCGHWGEFYWLGKSRDMFPMKQIVIIEVPKYKNTFAYKRFQKYNNLDDYMWQEQRTLYSMEVVEKCFGIKDIWTISSEEVINEVCCIDSLKDMNYDVDEKLCNEMHQIWSTANLNPS